MIATAAIIVILAILAFFVLFFTIRVRITLELKDEISLWVNAFGIRINILPKKQKKYKLSDYTPKKIARRDKKKAKKDAKKAAKKAEKNKKKAAEKKLSREEKKALKKSKKASRPSIRDSVSLFADIAKLFFSGFFSHLHFHIARIKVRVGSDDAAKTAILYGAIYASLRPVLTLIDRISNLHRVDKAEIDIQPDYLSEELKLDMKLGFSMSLGGLLGVLIKAAFKLFVGWSRIKPEAPETSQDKEKFEKNSTDQISEAGTRSGSGDET